MIIEMARPIYVCVVLTFALIGAGLPARAEGRGDGAAPPMRALDRDITASKGETAPETQSIQFKPQKGPAGILTLRRALELALIYNPDITASSHGVLAAEGIARQAGALPNPELEVEMGEFGGSGARKGLDSAESSLRLSQTVELGGKRGKRQRAAQSEARLAGWEYETKRLEVLTKTRKAFVDLLLAQGQLSLAEALMKVAEDIRKAAAEKVKAGKVPPLEETRAAVEAATARIAWGRAGRELTTARMSLAAAWGEDAPVFKEAGGELDAVMDIPSFESLAALLDGSPELARWNEESVLHRESLSLSKAERIPDLVVSAGISRFEEDGGHAGTLGLSMPLPLFDRKAGGVLAARHQAIRAEYEHRAARLHAATELREAYGRLETTRTEALSIKEELIPGAQQAFEAAQTGYREGKFRHLEVLDAQRTLGEAKARHLEVLAAYHKAAADVERLTGAALNTIQ